MFTRIRFYSTSLQNEVDKHLETQEQKSGYFTDLGIDKKLGNTYYSHLPLKELIWKLSSYFNQSFQNSIQFGEFGLVDNKTLQGKADRPFSNNSGIGDKQVWANAFIAEYENEAHEAINNV